MLNTVHDESWSVRRLCSSVTKQVIDTESLIDAAYAIASRDGISARSARKVALACGVAIGSVYAHHPTKDALR